MSTKKRSVLCINARTLAQLGQLGFGAYGEKMLGAGQDFVQHGYAKFLSGHALRYYFTVSGRSVRAKLRLLLYPFASKGQWARAMEASAVGGGRFKPPCNDLHAPDLYLPAIAFCTYCLVCCLADAVSEPSRFRPERLARFAWWASVAWAAQATLLWAGLRSLSMAQSPVQVPVLDLVSYSGYGFVLVSVQCVAGLLSRRAYYALLLWGCLVSPVFLVKTMRRIVAATAEAARPYGGAAAVRHTYLLAGLALCQLPFNALLGHLRTS